MYPTSYIYNHNCCLGWVLFEMFTNKCQYDTRVSLYSNMINTQEKAIFQNFILNSLNNLTFNINQDLYESD